MAENLETEGIVLFARDYREKDKLVKIFTERYGKVMFFVRNIRQQNHELAPAIIPLTRAHFVGAIRQEGLSFLNSVKERTPYPALHQDLYLHAYATYLAGLVDAAIEDHEYDPALYGFLREALGALETGLDAEVVTNIFELQILHRFGVAFHWSSCAVCGETQGRFDFSERYHGVLCERHFSQDGQRLHAAPKAVHFARIFAQAHYTQIESIAVQRETKDEIRQLIDTLYERFVGIHLKSKKFIDSMHDWTQKTAQIPKRQRKEKEGIKRMELQQATLTDLAAIQALYRKTAQWLKDKGSKQWNFLLDPGVLDSFAETVEAGHFYLVKEENQLRGAAILYDQQEAWDQNLWGEKPERDYLYLHRFTLDRDYQGQNLGECALRAIEEFTQTAGYKGLRLDCWAGNPGGNRLYQRLGYPQVGLVNEVNAVNFTGDFHLYQKDF